MNENNKKNKERKRIAQHYSGEKDWLKWGPYVSERQWGTVREDYSEHGNAWDYLPHDHARSRAYRWGEDGLAGISNDHQELCFAMALWNGRDPILKERLYGLNGSEGNHGEDVKELYYYLDNTPSHSYMKMLYKYPQEVFPYSKLSEISRSNSRADPEYELLDTGIFDQNRYFDVFIEYAKADFEDILIKITAFNRGPESATLCLMPTLWFRNRWDFGLVKEKPSIILKQQKEKYGFVQATHRVLGSYHLYFPKPDRILFTENETNNERLFNYPNKSSFVKDAFHEAVVNNNFGFLEGKKEGTKFSPLYKVQIETGKSCSIQLRLTKNVFRKNPFGAEFVEQFTKRRREADEYYEDMQHSISSNDLKNIQRQAFAGMLWSKQYYNIDIPQWLSGDPGQPEPPESRKQGRNHEWKYLNNADIISMPDKWEYPWYASWDLAFHCVSLAHLDANFAKNQLILILREWYMHPNGQIPAYEWAFGDVNPPVQAWAALKVFEIDYQNTGKPDITFLKRVFHKLILNFTWWVNRKDEGDKNIFEGGFLGLDNIGIFDRSHGLPGSGTLQQADGTCWMGMYALNMLEMAMIIAEDDPSYEDVCTKFFEHFVYIAESLNEFGVDKNGLWDEDDGLFYDQLTLPDGQSFKIKVKSLVGLTALFATSYIPRRCLNILPNFKRGVEWFRAYRGKNCNYLAIEELREENDVLLPIVHISRFKRMLQLMLDENEFLSPSGIRSVSRYHQKERYCLTIDGEEYGLAYEPGESTTGMFGGNSNWRGPVWMPMNYLLIDSLYKYYGYYGNSFLVECPTGSGNMMNLKEVAEELSKRLISIFQKDSQGRRKVHGNADIYARDPYFKDLLLFYEYFDGDNGRGVGASHQTGWTGLVVDLIARISH